MRPDQQQVSAVHVIAVLDALARMPSVVVNLDGMHIPRAAVINARDAVAEYIAAVEEWQCKRHGADADTGSRAAMAYEAALDRLDAAHARMKGDTK